MNEQEKLKQLNREYSEIEIPIDLDILVRNAIKENRQQNQIGSRKKFNSRKIWQKYSIAAAIAFGVFVGGININPTLANTLSQVPVIGNIIKIFTFRDYKVVEEGFEANIKVPNLSGLENTDLENKLNEQFIAEGQKLYEDFVKQMEEIKKQGEGHIALETNYETKTDNDKILSIVLTNFTAMGSSDTTFKTYTVDKTNKSIITLSSLFKDKSYVQLISDNIKEQIRAATKADENKIYNLDSEEMPENDFKQIKIDQNFYINDNSQLVILFDKYEVAPGYMGTQEFIIPINEIENILLSRGLELISN